MNLLNSFKTYGGLFLKTPRIVYYLSFFLLVGVLYGRSVFFGIVYFDDHLWVKDFYSYLTRGIHWWEFFGKPDLVMEIYYRPLLNLSFAIDARLGSGSVSFFHATNLIFHGINVCLVFAVLNEWGMTRLRALVGALIFLVHPALVQAVVWIPGRTDSLLGLFCFAGLLSYLKFTRCQSWSNLVGYAICFFWALLTKETGIVLGFMIVTHAAMLVLQKQSSWKECCKILMATLVVVGFWAFMRWRSISGEASFNQDLVIGSFIKNLPSLWLYLGKIFLPFNLSVFPLRVDASLVFGFASAGILMLWIFCLKNRSFHKIIWTLMWLVIFLLPSLVLSDLEYEYRLYVPMLGAMILILELFPKNFSMRNTTVLSVVLISVFASSSWVYTDSFKDQWIFWKRASREAPHSPLAQRNLGAMYQLKGDFDQAIVYYQKALAINPQEKMVNNNLGLIYQNRGDREKAIEYYNREIQNHPEYDLTYYNLSLLLLKDDHFSEAEQLLKKSIELNPLAVNSYSSLIQIYLLQGKMDEAKVMSRRLKSIGSEIPQVILEKAKKLNVDLTSL